MTEHEHKHLGRALNRVHQAISYLQLFSSFSFQSCFPEQMVHIVKMLSSWPF